MNHPLEFYSAYLDGHCLSDAEVEALRVWINADERNAREFVDFAMLHAAITDRLKLGRLLEDLASHRHGDVVTPEVLAAAIQEIELNSPRVVIPQPAPEAPKPAVAPLSQIWASIAASIAIVCCGAWLLWKNYELPPIALDSPKSRVAVPAPDPPKVVAQLVTSFDAKWGNHGRVRSGENLTEGTRLKLLGGVVQLNMADGASVVVEGPSDLQLTDSDALDLAQGKAAIRIEGAAESFVVTTPTLQVVDLGTEFGVETAPSGDGQVMVFDGSVALSDAARETSPEANRLNNHQRQLGAGFQVRVGPPGNQPLLSAPEPLVNPRYFLRPDEVEVRLRALAGSISDRKLASHYERLRIDGLLAYQGFDANSAGRQFIVGVADQEILAIGEMTFVEGGGKTGGVEVKGGPAFMLLDTSANGPFARTGLLNDSGRVGQAGKEIWLTWKSQRLATDSDQQGSAGVSLMFGDRSDLDEPMFFGRGFGVAETLIAQSAWGNAPPPEGERITVNIDADEKSPGVQDQDVDDRLHTWVARVSFRDGADRVSVWLDSDLSTIESSAPHGILDTADVEFDRIRLAVHRGDEVWRFSEFAAASHPEALVQLTQIAAFRADK